MQSRVPMPSTASRIASAGWCRQRRAGVNTLHQAIVDKWGVCSVWDGEKLSFQICGKGFCVQDDTPSLERSVSSALTPGSTGEIVAIRWFQGKIAGDNTDLVVVLFSKDVVILRVEKLDGKWIVKKAGELSNDKLYRGATWHHSEPYLLVHGASEWSIFKYDQSSRTMVIGGATGNLQFCHDSTRTICSCEWSGDNDLSYYIAGSTNIEKHWVSGCGPKNIYTVENGRIVAFQPLDGSEVALAVSSGAIGNLGDLAQVLKKKNEVREGGMLGDLPTEVSALVTDTEGEIGEGFTGQRKRVPPMFLLENLSAERPGNGIEASEDGIVVVDDSGSVLARNALPETFTPSLMCYDGGIIACAGQLSNAMLVYVWDATLRTLKLLESLRVGGEEEKDSSPEGLPKGRGLSLHRDSGRSKVLYMSGKMLGSSVGVMASVSALFDIGLYEVMLDTNVTWTQVVSNCNSPRAHGTRPSVLSALNIANKSLANENLTTKNKDELSAIDVISAGIGKRLEEAPQEYGAGVKAREPIAGVNVDQIAAMASKGGAIDMTALLGGPALELREESDTDDEACGQSEAPGAGVHIPAGIASDLVSSGQLQRKGPVDVTELLKSKKKNAAAPAPAPAATALVYEAQKDGTGDRKASSVQPANTTDVIGLIQDLANTFNRRMDKVEHILGDHSARLDSLQQTLAAVQKASGCDNPSRL